MIAIYIMLAVAPDLEMISNGQGAGKWIRDSIWTPESHDTVLGFESHFHS